MALDPPLPEVAFIGRSNVGKSSLLNALVGQRLAKTSATPGKTRMLNVFLTDGSHYFLDLPGYGYARAGKAQRGAFRGLLTHALRREHLAGVVWLLDIRHPPSVDDRAMHDVLVEGETHVLAALTKGDKLSTAQRGARERELREELGLPEDQVIVTSAKTGDGIADLRESIAALIKGVALALLLAVVPAWRLASQDTIPTGYGTLRRDDIVVQLSSGTIGIQLLPLEEQVIRLLAPDTYRSLRQLVSSRAAEIADAAQRGGTDHPTLVMVTFLGIVPEARFNPEEVNITSRGRLFRPIGIVPLSPTWSSFQLYARQQAAAIYLFEPGISVREELTVSYQGLSSDAWSRSIPLLDQERARVKARALLEAKRDSGAR